MAAPVSLCQIEEPIKIRSRLLDTVLWLVPENYAGPPLDAPTYSAAECALLLSLQPTPPQLQAIHLTKEILAGELIADEAETADLLARHPQLE